MTIRSHRPPVDTKSVADRSSRSPKALIERETLVGGISTVFRAARTCVARARGTVAPSQASRLGAGASVRLAGAAGAGTVVKLCLGRHSPAVASSEQRF